MFALVVVAGLVAYTSAVGTGESWGTNIHWTSPQPGEAAYLRKAYAVARMDLTWAAVERSGSCKTYDWSAYDTLVASATSVGLRLYLIIDYFKNDCYDGGTVCKSATCLDAYAAFGGAAMQRYAGHGFVFEIMNEPNGMGLINSTQEAIISLAVRAAAGPAAATEILVGPATSGIDMAYIEGTFKAGILSALDGVSVHPYRDTPPETALDDYVALRSLITKYAPAGKEDMPIYIGEWGYTTATPPCTYGNRVDEATQAKYLARIWLTSAMIGSPATINYDWKDDGADRTACESNFGSVHETYMNASLPYLPKPAYLAAVAAQTTIGIGEFDFRSKVTALLPPPGGNATDADVFVLLFVMPDETPGVAAWTNLSSCGAVNGSSRVDCGFFGISHDQCSARGCCWDGAATPNGPQCYKGLPANGPPLQVSFMVAPGDPSVCFMSVVDMLGNKLPPVCAVGGALTLNITDAPTYAAVFNWDTAG